MKMYGTKKTLKILGSLLFIFLSLQVQAFAPMTESVFVDPEFADLQAQNNNNRPPFRDIGLRIESVQRDVAGLKVDPIFSSGLGPLKFSDLTDNGSSSYNSMYSPVSDLNYFQYSLGLEDNFWSINNGGDSDDALSIINNNYGWSFDNYITDYSKYFTVGADNEYGRLTQSYQDSYDACYPETYNSCKDISLGPLQKQINSGAMTYFGEVRNSHINERINGCKREASRNCANKAFDDIQVDLSLVSNEAKSQFNNYLDRYRDFVRGDELKIPGLLSFNYISSYLNSCGEDFRPLEARHESLMNSIGEKLATNAGLNTKSNCELIKQRQDGALGIQDINRVTSDDYCRCMAQNGEQDLDDKYSGVTCDEVKNATKHYVAKELSKITSESMQVKNAALMAVIEDPSILQDQDKMNDIGGCLPQDVSNAQIPEHICPREVQDQMKNLMFQMVEKALPESAKNLVSGENAAFTSIDEISNANDKNLIVQNLAIYKPDLLGEEFNGFQDKSAEERLRLINEFDMQGFYGRLAESEATPVLEFSDEDAELLNNMEGVIANFSNNEEQFKNWFSELSEPQKFLFNKLNTFRHIRASDTAARQDIVFDGDPNSAWELAKFYRRETRFIRNGLRAQQASGDLIAAFERDSSMRDNSWFRLTGDLLNHAVHSGDVLSNDSALNTCREFSKKIISLCNVLKNPVPTLPGTEYNLSPPELDEEKKRYMNALGIEMPDNDQKFEQLMCYSRIAENKEQGLGNFNGIQVVDASAPEKDSFLNPRVACTFEPNQVFTADNLFDDFADEIRYSDREEWKNRCQDAARALPHDAQFQIELLAEPADENGLDGYDRHCSEPRPPGVGAVLANTLEALTQNDDVLERLSEKEDMIAEARARGASEDEIAALEQEAAAANFLYQEADRVNVAMGTGVRSNNQINGRGATSPSGGIVNTQGVNAIEGENASRSPASNNEDNNVRGEDEIASSSRRTQAFSSDPVASESSDSMVRRISREISNNGTRTFTPQEFKAAAEDAVKETEREIDEVETQIDVAKASGADTNDPAYQALLDELASLKDDQSKLQDMLNNEQELRRIAESEARAVKEEKEAKDKREAQAQIAGAQIQGSGVSGAVGGDPINAGAQVNAAVSIGSGGGGAGIAAGGGSVGGGFSNSGASAFDGDAVYTGNTINPNSIGTITLSSNESAPVFSAGAVSDQNTNYWSEMIQSSPSNYVLIQTEREGIFYRKTLRGEEVVTELVRVDETSKEIVVIDGTQKVDGREPASEEEVVVDRDKVQGSGSGEGKDQSVFKSNLDSFFNGINK